MLESVCFLGGGGGAAADANNATGRGLRAAFKPPGPGRPGGASK